MPGTDSCLGRLMVHHGVALGDKEFEVLDVNGLEVIVFQDSGDESVVVIALVQRVLPSRIVLIAAPQAGP